MQVQNISGKQITSKSKNYQKNEYTSHDRNDTKVKIASLAGTSIGIAAAMGTLLATLKKGGHPTKLSNLKYNEFDILKLAAGSILGGLTGGLLADKKENAKPKVREALQQFFGNIAVPISILALNIFLLKKSKFKMPLIDIKKIDIEKKPKLIKLAKKLNSILIEIPRIAVTIASLIGGLELGNRIMNKVNDKIFHEKAKREVKASDYSAHADDLCFASSLIFKDPKVQSIVSKILPATYLIAGYETGTKKNCHN